MKAFLHVPKFLSQHTIPVVRHPPRCPLSIAMSRVESTLECLSASMMAQNLVGIVVVCAVRRWSEECKIDGRETYARDRVGTAPESCLDWDPNPL